MCFQRFLRWILLINLIPRKNKQNIGANMFNDILCIIPARGGSKGIEHKNLQLVGDYPLFVHSVLHAIKNGIPKKQIVVSSDDGQILDIAKDLSVVSHKRSEVNSQDDSTTESCLIEVLSFSIYDNINSVVTLQPTSPIRRKNLLHDCMYEYKSGGYDSLITTTKLYDFLWYKLNENCKWLSTYNYRNRPTRQNLEMRQIKYFDCGSIYISNTQMLLSTGCRTGNNPCVFPISMLESIQIDDQNELKLVDLIFRGEIDKY